MKIFYLPGHGGQISNGLGQALVSRGYEVSDVSVCETNRGT